MTSPRVYALSLIIASTALLSSCGTQSAEPSGCTSTQNADGSVTIQCGDADPVTISTPEPGEAGEDGSSCSVADNGDGTKTLSCEDGTSVVVSDGADGTNGTNGLDGFDPLIKITAEPAGPNCATGGQKIEVGLDTNRDGVLDPAEIDAAQTAYVCTPDVDECALDIDGCEDVCTNTDGGFVCSCDPGRVLAADGKSCRVPSIFWATTGGSIWRADLDGTNPVEIVTTGGSSFNLEVNDANGLVYYGVDGDIFSVESDGSNPTLVSSAVSSVYGLSIDAQNGKLYASDFSNNRVVRMDLDGANVEVIDNANSPAGLDVDLVDQTVYYVTYNSTALRSVNTDGTNPTTLIPNLGGQGCDVVVDHDASKLYYVNRTNSVFVSDLDSSNAQVLASTPGFNQGIALHKSSNTLYVSGGSALYSVDVATGVVTTIVPQPNGNAWDIAVTQ
jgi:hypothetical protein